MISRRTFLAGIAALIVAPATPAGAVFHHDVIKWRHLVTFRPDVMGWQHVFNVADRCVVILLDSPTLRRQDIQIVESAFKRARMLAYA